MNKTQQKVREEVKKNSNVSKMVDGKERVRNSNRKKKRRKDEEGTERDDGRLKEGCFWQQAFSITGKIN